MHTTVYNRARLDHP